MSRPLVGTSLVAIILCASAPAFAQSNLANCKYYTNSQRDFAQGLPFCEKCLQEEPDNPEARYFGAWCLAEVGRYEEAWPSFKWLVDRAEDKDKSVKKYSQMASGLVSTYFAKHFNKGLELLKASDFQAARAEFEKASQVNPTKGSGFLNLAFTENKLGNVDASLVAYRKAIAIEPNRKESYEFFSEALRAKRVGLSAKGDSLRSSAPVDSTALRETEAGLREVTAENRQVLEKVVANDPTNDRALMQLGGLALSAGEDSAGIAYVEKAIEITPDNVVQLYNIAVSFYERDQFVNAAKAFRIVTDHVADPANDLWRDAMYNRALTLKASGSYQEALDCTLKLIEANDSDPEYHSLASAIYIELKDTKKAEEQYDRAKALKEQALQGGAK